MGVSGPLDVGWFGFSTTGGAFVLIGLGLAVLSVVAGVAGHRLLARRRATALPLAAAPEWAPLELVSVGPAGAALPPVGIGTLPDRAASFTGGEPLRAARQLRASDFSEPIATGLAPFYRWGDPDRYYLALWRAALAVAGAVGRASHWLEERAVAALLALAAVLGLVAGFGGRVTRAEALTATTPAGPLAVAVAVAAVALVLVRAGAASGRVWLGLVPGGLVAGGLLIEAELPRLVTCELGAFAAVALLVVGGAERAAARLYLVAAALSAVCLIAATLGLEAAPAGLVFALAVAGFAVKLALVPAYLWLPALAEKTPAALVGVVVAVVDVAAFAELVTLRQRAGWLFEPLWLWVGLGLLTAVGGALLALAQADVKKLVACSSITGAGFLVLGAAAGGDGLAGTAAGAVAEALALALLFGALAAAERDGPVTLSTHGLARRHPLACAGFLVGALAALGVPFTPGFAGHWRVYQAALDLGWWALAGLVVATALSVLAYARVVARVWWGGAPGEPPLPADRPPAVSVWAAEPVPVTVALAGLMALVLASGLFPGVLFDWWVP